MLPNIIRAACRQLLRPVVRMLLRLGIGWKEFAELAKVVFVEVAREDYGLHGRPTNASRVAMMTGLSRREVGEIRKQLDSEADDIVTPYRSRLSRVLTGWHTDEDFSEFGSPKELSADEFRTLTHRYAGDIPDRAIVKEMQLLKLLAVDGERYRVLARNYIRDVADVDIIRQMGQSLHDHGVSLAHNLTPHVDDAWFEGQASNTRMPCGSARALNRKLQIDAQGFLEHIDAWLSDNESPDHSNDDLCRVGVGIYLYEYPLDKADKS